MHSFNSAVSLPTSAARFLLQTDNQLGWICSLHCWTSVTLKHCRVKFPAEPRGLAQRQKVSSAWQKLPAASRETHRPIGAHAAPLWECETCPPLSARSTSWCHISPDPALCARSRRSETRRSQLSWSLAELLTADRSRRTCLIHSNWWNLSQDQSSFSGPLLTRVSFCAILTVFKSERSAPSGHSGFYLWYFQLFKLVFF